MTRRFGRHVRQHFVAYIALFFALGGTAIAAQKIPVFKGDPAGGDLSGTYPNPTVAKLNGLPGNDYGAVLSGRINGLTTGAPGVTADVGAASGISTASDAGDVTTLSPNHDLVARDLSVVLTDPPGAGRQREFTLIVGLPNSETDLACTVVGDSTSCADSSHQVSVPAGSTLAIEDSTDQNGAAAADAMFGFRLTPK